MELSDDLLNEIFGDLAADLVDLDDNQIKDRILTYGLSPADMKDVFDTVKAVQAAELEAGKSSDNLAQQLANEDSTAVKVTEQDKDADGDVDKTVIEKQNPEDDDLVAWAQETLSEPDNSSETEDKPHEENKTNHFANLISELR